MPLQSINIAPSILIWARESLGMTVTDAAVRLKRDVDEIRDWEAGRSQPTFAQLERLAYQVYKRPLAVFFLPEPPQEEPIQQSFRTIGSIAQEDLGRKTILQLRQAKARQLSLYELFDNKNPADSSLRNLRFSTRGNFKKYAQQVRDLLKLDWSEQQSWRDERLAYNSLRERITSAGIFVFHFTLKEIRGFALPDDEFPIIGISADDSGAGKLFTLLHELCHLLFQNQPVLDGDDLFSNRSPHQRIEKSCNEFAATFLMPPDLFEREVKRVNPNGTDWTDIQIRELGLTFSVSNTVVLRRLLDLKEISHKFYKSKTAIYNKKYRERKAKEGRTPGGPSHYVVKVSQLGKPYLNTVFDQLDSGKITTQQASEYTGVKISNFGKLLEKLG